MWALACWGGCSGGQDQTALLLGGEEPAEPGAEVSAFLGLPASAADSANSPTLLSETAAFADLERLEAAAGVRPYSVQSPLWSDGAVKRRWMALPGAAEIGFSEQGAWAFPEGTVFIKHFGMVLDERAPDEVRRLETRFLVAASGGEYYGLVYKWDDDQRDARLLLDGGEELLDIIGADGSSRQQRYTYPSQRSCASCHFEGSGYVIGARTAQLNGEYRPSAGELPGEAAIPGGNQLEAWAALGSFDGAWPGASAAHEQLAPLDAEGATLEVRISSYWDANCSSCHNDAAPFPSWDARFSTPLDQRGVLLAAPRSPTQADDVRLIVPGEPERSLIFMRSRSDQPGTRMPPLLRNRADERYIDLLAQWIESLPPP